MLFSIDYYQRPFLLFYKEIADKIKTDSFELRDSFWDLIPDGKYQNLRGQNLIRAYSYSLEQKAKVLVPNCIN